MDSIFAKSIARCALAATALYGGVVQAALFDRGGGLIYDSTLNVTWLANGNLAYTSGYSTDLGGRMSWDNAIIWADQLSFHDSVRNVDYTDWRLPAAVLPNLASTGSELAHLRSDLGGVNGVNLTQTSNAQLSLFTNVVLDVNQGFYWPGNQYAAGSLASLNFQTGNATREGYNSGPNATRHYAWALRNGDVLSPVPEPEAYRMLLAGLAVVAFLARRHRRLPA